MSYHILHVLKHGSVLSKERGMIQCRGQDGKTQSLPHEDIRAVIIAARGVTLTSHFMSAITDSNGIILHCNEHYEPCGITTPLQRIVDTRSYLHQANRPEKLNQRLWHHLLHAKLNNQRHVLTTQGLKSAHFDRALDSSFQAMNEADCARRYWQMFFPSIGWISSKRDRKEATPPNQMLNYGYAVLAALCHRSLIIHGLSPLLGVKHVTRYRSHPLVYDLMEPYRPMVDLMLAEFMTQPQVDFRTWCKKVGEELREKRLHHDRYTVKLMDAIDISASSMANSYSQMSIKPFWIPKLST